MASFVWKRILLMIPTLLGVSIVVFLMLKIVPGDPVNAIVPPDASESERALVRAQLGLDKPMAVQYVYWLGNVVQGDLGDSVARRLPVTDMLLPAFKNTLLLTAAAALASFIVALIVGVYSAYRPKSKLASLFNGLSLASIGLPNFWAALILIGVFSVTLGWLPSSGMSKVGGGGFGDTIDHLILPAAATALASVGVLTRMVRSTVSGVLQQDYIFALKAKGVRPFTILRHVLRGGHADDPECDRSPVRRAAGELRTRGDGVLLAGRGAGHLSGDRAARLPPSYRPACCSSPSPSSC
ncbi:ABC transporter permease [Cohnella rhizosphaerae]|uniref:ABC transporter permease n=1 Tax=Cohnella rhizosphaerae TaxID=1457232 RepID=A0A9X4KU78_9BACL|nr:ABC transporter permease [Cohnella rhizosphaerae]MDG0811080.1 ABC transporter permease [Cohnella rhizosphaerae]